ncbi:MAG: molybdopterin synthase catalytic subunit MoaE [Gammaproteobacteria bacterium]|nr:MAG: molybdopterin synthase catalytic subunit MoaE [Gammaproteobacteria bacterium]
MIRVQTQDFDAGDELEQMRTRCNGNAGAVVSFTGLVRDTNEGGLVSQLTLEHYPGMTEKALTAIEQEAGTRWDLNDSVIIHRVGPLMPNDRIVFVAAASSHRKDAFRACEYMIDALKTEAPFWKQEDTPAGRRWVTAVDRGKKSNRA